MTGLATLRDYTRALVRHARVALFAIDRPKTNPMRFNRERLMPLAFIGRCVTAGREAGQGRPLECSPSRGACNTGRATTVSSSSIHSTGMAKETASHPHDEPRGTTAGRRTIAPRAQGIFDTTEAETPYPTRSSPQGPRPMYNAGLSLGCRHGRDWLGRVR